MKAEKLEYEEVVHWEVQAPLKDTEKKYLIERHKDLNKYSISLRHLVAQCNKVEESSSYHFGLFVWRSKTASIDACVKFDYEFAILTKKPSYIGEGLQNHVQGRQLHIKQPVRNSWTDFMANDSEYFCRCDSSSLIHRPAFKKDVIFV